MMVRYSDRGLVKNGVVSKLFGHLYLAFTIIISLWGSAIGFIAYIFNRSSNLKHDAFMQFCTNQTQERNSIALYDRIPRVNEKCTRCLKKHIIRTSVTISL